jgi:hypothetical protein
VTLASRLTGPLAVADTRVNDLHDVLNARAGALWWPLSPPPPDRTLGPPEHAMYAAHMVIALGALRVVGAGRRTSLGLLLAGAVGWAVFTGAWDRRAYGAAGSVLRRSR